MGQTLRKMKKRTKKKMLRSNKSTRSDGEDFEESSVSSSWVSTLPSRDSAMSCPTDESTTCSTTNNTTTTADSGLTQSQSAEPLSAASSSTALPLSSEVIEDATESKEQPASSEPVPSQASTPNPFPPSSVGDYSSYSTSTGTCRSSNTSADYSELKSIRYSTQPGEVHMYESDFAWIEAAEGFLTEEVISRSVVPPRRPAFALRGKKPSAFAQNYRTLYRNLMNKKGAGK